MTTNQEQVLEILDVYGPMADQALVPLTQHMGGSRQSSSGIRSRRAELVRLGLVESVDVITTPSGRSAAVWACK